MRLKIFRGEFARFLLAGVINTLSSYLLYLLMLSFFAYLWAYSIAYCIGVVISYLLNVHFVFKQRASLVTFMKFPAVYVIQYGLGAGMLWLLVDSLGMPAELAMMAVIVATIPVTFLASRLVLTR